MREIKCPNCHGKLVKMDIYFICQHCESTFFDEEIAKIQKTVVVSPYESGLYYTASYYPNETRASYVADSGFKKIVKSFWGS